MTTSSPSCTHSLSPKQALAEEVDLSTHQAVHLVMHLVSWEGNEKIERFHPQ